MPSCPAAREDKVFNSSHLCVAADWLDRLVFERMSVKGQSDRVSCPCVCRRYSRAPIPDHRLNAREKLDGSANPTANAMPSTVMRRSISSSLARPYRTSSTIVEKRVPSSASRRCSVRSESPSWRAASPALRNWPFFWLSHAASRALIVLSACARLSIASHREL